MASAAAAVPEDPVSAAGTQPGSVLRRVSAKRQPDWKRGSGRDLSGEENLTPSASRRGGCENFFFFSQRVISMMESLVSLCLWDLVVQQRGLSSKVQ